MLSVHRAVLFASVLSLLAGCTGKDFVRPSSEAFRLGQTTHAQVIQQMGEPHEIGDVWKNEKYLKIATYSYIHLKGEPLEEGVSPVRLLSYYFYHDILVGEEFQSSFKADNSNFDETKISMIYKGKTTRFEVVQLLAACRT